MPEQQTSEIPVVRDCLIPRDLLYETQMHLWLRPEDDGTLTVGLTDMAQTLAGKILYCTPRPAGLQRPANKPVAILEAAKWLGVIRVPFPTVIVASNEKLRDNPFAINQDPYGEGWVVRLAPDSDDWRSHLVNGTEAPELYRAKFDEWQLEDCVHCLGAEL